MKEKLLGEITHFFPKIKVAVAKFNKKVKIGDVIRIKGNKTDFEQEISSMQIDYKDIKEAKKGEEVGLKVDEEVREGDKIYEAEN